MRYFRYSLLGVACMAMLIATAGKSNASLALDYDDRGWYGGATSPGLHTDSNENTIMGGYRDNTNVFFIFDLTSVVDTVTSATLELELESYNWHSSSSVDVDIYEVLFDADTVDNSHSSGSAEGIAIHDDLQDGLKYGSATVTAASVGSITSFELNSAAIVDINSKLGSRIVFGLHSPTPYENIGTGFSADWIRWSSAEEARHHVLMTTQSAVPVPVLVDIKPGSIPNSVNLKSKGVLPVAILGTADFDVNEVDIDSLLFGDPLFIDNGGTALSPLRSALEDVNVDGFLDLSLKFSMVDLVGNGALNPDTIEGILIGLLVDGTSITGMDSIRIVPPKGSNANSLQVSAVPEPSTLALTALGLLGIGWRRQKRA